MGQDGRMTEPVGRLLSVVFECADLNTEAQFWQDMLGYLRRPDDDPDWATIMDPDDRTKRLSFQRVDDHVPPTWPARDRPQQAHFDLLVTDLDAADARAKELGARRLTDEVVDHDEEYFHVYADPAGHPFCLIVQQAPDL